MLSEGTLKVIVHSARHLVDVEHGGRNDPYVKLSLTHEGEDSYQRTTVKEDAGSQASWDETFEFAYSGEPNLYIEVMDKEKGVDELIGFAAIPLAQAPVSGVFDIFDTKGTIAGAVHISINDDGSSEPVPATSFVEKETLSMMEEAQKQQEQDRERLSQLQQKYREERIKQQKLAARKIAPGFLDTETRILKPEPLHQLGEESESMRRQQQVDYLRFEQALAPPDPWDQPENDMMALRSILGANNQPITTATTTTTNSITHAQQHTPSQVTSANEQQGYPPVMWTVAPDTTNNGQFQHPPPPTAGPRPHHHTSSPPIAPALPPKPFFDTSACSSGHTSPQTVTSILPNATTAIASSSPSDPSNSPIIPPPLPPPPPAPPASATHPAHDNLIQELVNMGFSRPQAADALEKNDHDLTKATNFLLDHGGD